MESRFLIKEGQTWTSLRRREEEWVGMSASPVHCTGSEAPLPTMMQEEEGEVERSLPASAVMCVNAPVSRTQSPAFDGED